MKQITESGIPWYRQFWPWFLIALPACALIAGSWTWVIALQYADEPVPEPIETHIP